MLSKPFIAFIGFSLMLTFYMKLSFVTQILTRKFSNTRPSCKLENNVKTMKEIVMHLRLNL